MEVPKKCELSWSAAVFLGLKCGGAVLCIVLGSVEKAFGNKFLCVCVYLLMHYAVYEL